MNSLPSPDGRSLIYFDSEREGGYGEKDLWWVYTENIGGARSVPAARAPPIPPGSAPQRAAGPGACRSSCRTGR